MPITVDQISADLTRLTAEISAETRRMARAREAKGVLEHPLVVEAFALLEARIDKARETSARGDVATREYVHDLWIHLRDFKGFFEDAVRTGELAEPNIRSLEQRREFQERRLKLAGR